MKRHIFVNALFVLLFFVTGTFAQTLSWGYNQTGQLGVDTTNTREPMPKPIAAGENITGIGSGWAHTLFLKSDGTILATGENEFGQLGFGFATYRYTRPVPVPNLTDVVQLAAGANHSMALKADGTVWTWGGNYVGQLGLGFNTNTGCLCIASAVQVPGLTDVVAISAGRLHSFAVRSDGTVWGWGYNDEWELGDGTRTTRLSPVQIGVDVPGFTDIISVSTEESRSIALGADGNVWKWGTYQDHIPSKQPELSEITQVVAGQAHLTAIRRDGSVYIWRIYPYNGSDPCEFCTQIPRQLNFPPVVEVAAGFDHIILKKRDGSIWTIGANGWGQIGNGTFGSGEINYTPVQSSVGTGNVLIDATWYSSFAARPVLQLWRGSGPIHFFGDHVSLDFPEASNKPATISYRTIDPTATGLIVPAGYTIEPNQPAYNIASSIKTLNRIQVCIKAPNEYDRTRFALLKLLHMEGKEFIDRTFSNDPIRREICAQVESLGTFVVAKAGTGFGKE